ncbi:MAG: hypothetical protein KTR13_05970 [Saprospiraceae bacterium]|nr:hypothetical protein [Saprospiraceae bacterium]
MKSILSILFLSALVLASCSKKESTGKKGLLELGSTRLDNSDIKHYVCPNACEGSGASASGQCPTCGSAYNHNPAFHGDAEGMSTLNSLTLDAVGKADPVKQPVTPSLQPSTSSATTQRASSVYHYKCANSACTGGSDDKNSVCDKCAGKLTHNQAYHNTPSDVQAPVGSLGSPFPQPSNLSKPASPISTTNSSTTTTTTNSGGIPHYICTQAGCGKGTGVNRTDSCSACGEPLSHNEAYHG